jgi:hypothetical protein
MLLDIRKDAESIFSLIAYLETKPKRERYEYPECLDCGLSQYFSEKFGRRMYVDETHYGEVAAGLGRGMHIGDMRRLPEHFNKIAIGDCGIKGWTFGGMLARARKAAATAR